MKKFNTRYKNKIRYVVMVLAVVLGVQIFDSYCAELYEKVQSFILTEFLIESMNMEMEAAVGFLSLAAIPFYAVTSLAPAVRSLIDIWGKKKLLIMNMLILISGCLVCIQAQNLFWYLFGNGIVTFACTMDIQYIYIVEEIPERWRATVRGMAGGVAAGTGMSIPIFRRLLISRFHGDWRSLYIAGGVIGVGIFLYVILFSAFIQRLKEKENCGRGERAERTGNEESQQADEEESIEPVPKVSGEYIRIKQMLYYIWKEKEIRNYLLLLFLMGSAAAGITFYNEPMISFSGMSEAEVSRVLFFQPVVTLLLTLFSGFAADRIKRSRIIALNTILAGLSICGFCLGISSRFPPVLIGVLWGIMIGAYFSAANLLTLMVMEAAPGVMLGRISAVSTYVNGAGNAAGMLTTGLLVSRIHMTSTKLILTLPVFLAVLYCLNRFQKGRN